MLDRVPLEQVSVIRLRAEGTRRGIANAHEMDGDNLIPQLRPLLAAEAAERDGRNVRFKSRSLVLLTVTAFATVVYTAANMYSVKLEVAKIAKTERQKKVCEWLQANAYSIIDDHFEKT